MRRCPVCKAKLPTKKVLFSNQKSEILCVECRSTLTWSSSACWKGQAIASVIAVTLLRILQWYVVNTTISYILALPIFLCSFLLLMTIYPNLIVPARKE
jgi:hypothetical protein